MDNLAEFCLFGIGLGRGRNHIFGLQCLFCLFEGDLAMDGVCTLAGGTLSGAQSGGVVSDAALQLERLWLVLGVHFGCVCTLDMGSDGNHDDSPLSRHETRTNNGEQ